MLAAAAPLPSVLAIGERVKRVIVMYYFNYGYTSIINRLSADITRIKNGIAIYNLLNKNIVKLIFYTL